MKPRTKMHLQVLNLSKNYLMKLSADQEAWAKKECLDHKGFATKKKVNCLDCGGSFAPELVKRKIATCPHCATKLTVEQTRKTTDKQISYFAIAEIIDDFQVVRNWQLIANYKAGNKVYYHCTEVLQHWVLPGDGKREVIARNHTVNWNYDSWTGDLEIRDRNNLRRYDLYPAKYHPCSVFQDEYVKCGINHKLQGLTFLESKRILPYSSKAETLLKAKQFALFGACDRPDGRIHTYWPSIRICLRKGYKVKDAVTWLDYLDLLSFFNKDLRSPVYVCVRDLKKRHDRLVAKKREVQKKRDLEEQRRRIERDEKAYLLTKKPFFGLVFQRDNLSITVLESVKEFLEEGDAHKHCVYTNRYYDKKDSLVLSARIDGKPMETIEIDLKSLKIVQSRGKGNNPSEYNKQILQLMRKNIPVIKKRLLLLKHTG